MSDIVLPPAEYDPVMAQDPEAYPNEGMLVRLDAKRFREIAENARTALSSGDEAMMPLGNGVMELAQEVGAQQHRFNLTMIHWKPGADTPKGAPPAPKVVEGVAVSPVAVAPPPVSRPIIFQAVTTALAEVELTSALGVAEFMSTAEHMTKLIMGELDGQEGSRQAD